MVFADNHKVNIFATILSGLTKIHTSPIQYLKENIPKYE